MQEQPLLSAINELQKMPKINIKGKSYATVASRVEAFRRYFPLAKIETSLILDDGQRVVIQTKIEIDGTLTATGLAEEVRGDGYINTTSAIENCETSSIGRALAAMSLHGGEYASSFEVENAIEQQKGIQKQIPTQQPSSSQSKTQQQSPQAQYEFASLFNLGLKVLEQNNDFVITGENIFNKKDSIKACGFFWDSSRKVWYMPKRGQEAA